MAADTYTDVDEVQIKADDMEISRLTPDTPGLSRRPQVPGCGWKMVPSNPILQRHAPSLGETFYKISCKSFSFSSLEG